MPESIIISPLVTNILAIAVALVLVATLLLPKMARHIVHSLLLLTFGVIPLLHQLEVIGFGLPDWPILQYAITVIVILSGRTLVIDGFREENKALKFSTMIAGIIIVLMVTIPTLQRIGAITFEVNYPAIVNYIFYVIAGLLLFIGSFVLQE